MTEQPTPGEIKRLAETAVNGEGQDGIGSLGALSVILAFAKRFPGARKAIAAAIVDASPVRRARAY